MSWISTGHTKLLMILTFIDIGEGNKNYKKYYLIVCDQGLLRAIVFVLWLNFEFCGIKNLPKP